MTHNRSQCSVRRRRRKRGLFAAAGLGMGMLSILSVESSQIPTYQKPQEPDAAPYDNSDTQHPPRRPDDSHDQFMTWCTQVLGIQTSLTIKDFEYPNFMKIRMSNEDDEDLCDDDVVVQEELITVRGLAASHDIQVGVSIMMMMNN